MKRKSTREKPGENALNTDYCNQVQKCITLETIQEEKPVKFHVRSEAFVSDGDDDHHHHPMIHQVLVI